MARTMDVTNKATFPVSTDFSASTWASSSPDSWVNVYTWVNSQNDSDNGDSIRSSTSSQPQTSPSSGLDDHEHRLLCDTPSSPIEQPNSFFNNNNQFNNNNNNKISEFDWFNPPPLHSPAPVQQNQPVKPEIGNTDSKDYGLLQELLRLNLNSSSPPAPVAAPVPPVSTVSSLFSSSTPSTSSPWSLPPDEPPLYRTASAQMRSAAPAPPVAPAQNMYWGAGRNQATSDAEFLQALSNQMAAAQISAVPKTQPSGVDMTYILQQQALAVQEQQRANSRQWAPKAAYHRYTLISALQAKVDEVTEEYRQLEKERKQTEAELARHNLGKKISSSNGLPIPKLPTAPSRIDRMVVDFFREHARISTLLAKMEQLTGTMMPLAAHQTLAELLEAITRLYHSRVHERSLILQQLRGEPIHYDEEKEAGVLVEILCHVQLAATRVRAANWFCLMTTLGPLDHNQRIQMERIVASDYTLAPPPIRPRPV